MGKGLLLWLGCWAGASGAFGAPPPAWNSYQVIMWSTDSPKDQALWFQRLREIGFTAEECYRGRDPKPFVEHGFGFYVENLVPQLAFLHGRRQLYDEDFKGYTTTRQKRFLVRRPCFHDPAFWEEMERYLKGLIPTYAPHRPLLYNLQDELSLGSFASPMDYCFGPHTLGAFRQWLRKEYGSLEALNREWETAFSSWEEVEPMTTYEVKDRERKALAAGGLENYAPWADHRAFMDLTFAQTLARLKAIIRTMDPTTPVGIEGTQMPSAWGGYDLWRLAQEVDWVEPYDIANSREIFRSFLPSSAILLSTVFGSDFSAIRRKLWRLLLHGDRGCIVWDDEKSRCIEKTREGMPITERGKGLAPIFAELKRFAPLLFGLERVDDRIAIHYSQASIRAHWMFDSREDGDTWPRRFSSYEAAHSRLAQVRESFVKVIEDLGLQYRFISYEQIEEGELLRGGYRVLLLPQSVAMSPKECEQVRAFVQAGGMVIADNMTATMDEHCRRLPQGQLDDLFGLRRRSVGWRPQGEGGTLPAFVPGSEPWTVFEPDLSLTTGKARFPSAKAPAVIENRWGKGRTVYLNLDLREYRRWRLSPPKGDGLRELFRQLLQEAGVEAPVKVFQEGGQRLAECVEVWRYRGQGAEYVAVMRNADSSAAAWERPERVRILFPHRASVREIRTGQAFGLVQEVSLELEPFSPLLFELRRGGASPKTRGKPSMGKTAFLSESPLRRGS